MTTQQAEQLTRLTSQLAETLVAALICAEELRTKLVAEIEQSNGKQKNELAAGVSSVPRPLLDQSTFSVIWRGKRLGLGHTRQFWLLNRLAQCPNQFVTHLDLLHDVWDSEELTTATIRSVVRHLRYRLRCGGMADLADAIQGHHGHYVLNF